MRFMRLRLGLGLTLMTVVVLFGWLAPGAQALDTADLYCGTQTCYEVLGLTQSASDRDIRKAFRSLSLIYHPGECWGSWPASLVPQTHNEASSDFCLS